MPESKSGRDVWMLERRGGLDLHHEALGAEHGQLGLEDLERDLAIVLEVLRQVHGGHATLAELALEEIAVGEGQLQAFPGILHRSKVLAPLRRLPAQSCAFGTHHPAARRIPVDGSTALAHGAFL